MEIFEYEAGRSFDRRIGRRTVTPPIDVAWIVPANGLLRTVRERPGSIEEVSLTGAAITGPTNLKMKVSDTVLVRFAGGESSVIVRRIDPVDSDTARYAVELMVVHPVLKRQLLGALSHPDGGDMGSTSFSAATPPAAGAAGGRPRLRSMPWPPPMPRSPHVPRPRPPRVPRPGPGRRRPSRH